MGKSEAAKGPRFEARIYGGPLDAVLQTIERHDIGWLVSAINEDHMLPTPPGFLGERHLQLAMNDINVEREGLVLPAEGHVRRLLEFVERWDQKSPLMIHCWAGVSRSTAGIYISLCHLNQNRDEAEIAQILRAASPTATPNVRLVELADQLLARRGRMVEAILNIGQGEMTMQGDVFSVSARLEDG